MNWRHFSRIRQNSVETIGGVVSRPFSWVCPRGISVVDVGSVGFSDESTGIFSCSSFLNAVSRSPLRETGIKGFAKGLVC